MINSSLVIVGFMSPLALCVLSLYVWRWYYRSRRRRSPIIDDLLRQPAQGLREQLDDLN